MIGSQGNIEKYMCDFGVGSVPADGLALLLCTSASDFCSYSHDQVLFQLGSAPTFESTTKLHLFWGYNAVEALV